MNEKTCEFCKHYDYDKQECKLVDSYMGLDMTCGEWEDE